jgi:hypothetical protein
MGEEVGVGLVGECGSRGRAGRAPGCDRGYRGWARMKEPLSVSESVSLSFPVLSFPVHPEFQYRGRPAIVPAACVSSGKQAQRGVLL